MTKKENFSHLGKPNSSALQKFSFPVENFVTQRFRVYRTVSPLHIDLCDNVTSLLYTILQIEIIFLNRDYQEWAVVVLLILLSCISKLC